MTIERVPADSAIDKAELHARLLDWFAATSAGASSDPTVGPVGTGGVIGRTPWVHVRDETGDLFSLHADVKRSSVLAYLKLAVRHGSSLTWTVVENAKVNMNAVAYGPDEQRITPFYLYLEVAA